MLKNDTILLRAVELSDVDTLYRWENDTSQWATANTHAPMSRTQLWQYANDYSADIYAQHALRLMICLTASGRPIGTIDIYDFDAAHGHATVGVYISRHHRGQGYGVQALQLAGQYASQCVGMKQLIAITAADNAASQAMLAAAGYQHCGTLRQWLRQPDSTFADALVFQRIFI